MSMSWTVEKTDGGGKYLRVVSWGRITAEDAQQFSNVIQPGAEHEGVPLLACVEPGADYSPQARKMFGEMGGPPGAPRTPMAVVVPNAPLRVMIRFILKISGLVESTRFFANETEARQWLFTVVDGDTSTRR